MGGAAPQGFADGLIVDLSGTATAVTDHEMPAMGLVGRDATDKCVERLDAVDKTVHEEKLERPIDRRRRRASPFAVQFLENVIGAPRLMAAPNQLQHTTPERGQPHPLPFT